MEKPKKQIQRFCSNVKVIRLAEHMSQKELAKELGMRQEHLSRLEHGHRTPTLEKAIRIAEALGYTMTELLTIEYE